MVITVGIILRVAATSVVACALFVAAACAHAAESREPILGGPCEGCELVFEGIPPSPASEARIAPPDEPGEPLRIEGLVTEASGKPAAGVIVYAYHTDATGIYPRGPTRHGRLRGWAATDERGRYRFDTIRPGAYPGGSEPQHVHMHVIEPAYGTYWIGDILFTDDPLLTEERRRRADSGRGGSGVCSPDRDAEGRWHVRRDIVLGREVPGYRH